MGDSTVRHQQEEPRDPAHLTLGELVTLAAREPTRENREAVYARLRFAMLGGELPQGYEQRGPGTFTTGADDEVGFPTTVASDGTSVMMVVCDLPTVVAAIPERLFFGVEGQVVLQMARDGGMGVLVQNLLDDGHPSVHVPVDAVVDILDGKYGDTTVVPPGMLVNVVMPAAVPQLVQLETGHWIADMGNGWGVDKLRDALLAELADEPAPDVVWIVQPMVLEEPAALETAEAAIRALAESQRGAVNQLVVAPYASARYREQLRQLQSCGVPVHYGGPNGECLIEIHRPDGIELTLPGHAFKG